MTLNGEFYSFFAKMKYSLTRYLDAPSNTARIGNATAKSSSTNISPEFIENTSNVDDQTYHGVTSQIKYCAI